MKKRKKNPVFVLIFLAALAAFLFASIKLGSTFYRYYDEDSTYRDLESFAELDQIQSQTEESSYISPIDFNSLAEINPDIIGWIYFESMDINYPIVQGDDNNLYLRHGFYKEDNTSGCIFMDIEASPDFSSMNSFIYGHNMRNKTMFANLNQYVEEEFFLENKTFLIYTPTEMRRYEIYSCYQAKLGSDSFTYSFDDPKEYAKWIDTVKGRSLYDTGVTPDASDLTVTLMTCTPKGSDYRLLIHSRLME